MTISLLPVDGIGEVYEGDDLAALLLRACGADGLRDGDIVVLTSKVVSKAEGRAVIAERADLLAGETDRVVARRGATTIARTHHGLVMAGAGIDASNVNAGTSLLLPRDPDGSARAVRERLHDLTDLNVALVVSDTAGRAWRAGQTDLAIGAAGLEVLHNYAGRVDDYGNDLVVTAPAVADEIAGAGDLVKGKLGRRPAAVVRGLGDLVLPVGVHGPGAAALVRPEEQDMFGLGAREAVLAALDSSPDDLRGFGAAASSADVADVLAAVAGARVEIADNEVVAELHKVDERELGRLETRATTAAFALGWVAAAPPEDRRLRFRKRTP